MTGNDTADERLKPLYHVPRSQVWQGSRGGQAGLVHLHAKVPLVIGRIARQPHEPLCDRKRRGWYEREPETGEQLCSRCVEIAARLSAL